MLYTLYENNLIEDILTLLSDRTLKFKPPLSRQIVLISSGSHSLVFPKQAYKAIFVENTTKPTSPVMFDFVIFVLENLCLPCPTLHKNWFGHANYRKSYNIWKT